MRYVFFAVLGLVTLATPVGLHAQDANASPAVLEPGDSVRIDVWRKPELSGSFVVAGDGTVRHPLYREVRVVDVPLAQLESRIGTFLAKYETDPQFVVEPRFRVSVGGAVGAPKLYSFGPETTVAQAVVMAGGASEDAAPSRTELFRGDNQYLVDLTKPGTGLATSTIRSGDRIVIPRRRNIFRDYVTPALSFTGAISSVLILLRFAR